MHNPARGIGLKTHRYQILNNEFGKPAELSMRFDVENLN